ncbi:rust resistance kinase Lr10-like isoform X1 [Populus alba x Populus x berolinensis]|uniref:Rust resistance kinase Lr10-like isoform X1 n=1 Tax=Populus alba x Populus x berolinensis TaxID=444605 RepID=A0AAD6VXT2_9ROSI|nr:rust resistance kinase Lr10-like isoform X1 [Populus alba x Populus x berolinensis]
MMRGSTKKAICLFYFMFIAELGVSLNCTGSCGNHGLEIRFPFWIKDRQPEQCGYSGFDLSCNEMGDIVLELPAAVKLYIDKIDYKNQVIYASDPQGCLRSHHSDFNSSVFHIQFKMSKDNFTIFNCSLNNATSRPKIPCLSTPHYDVLAVDSEQSIDDNELLSCTKMYDLPVQRDIRLSWSNPKCGYCEETGKQCRLRINSSSELETECYGLPRLKKGVTTGSIFFGVLVIAVYQIYSFRKSEEEYQAKVERFLDDYRAMNPTRYSHADLKKMTNQFRDELGQGAYGTVFKGKLTSEIPVAVKVLSNSSEKGEEFVNEMETMARIHHVNVVRLIGFCADGFRRALVYEYLPNDSLQKFISPANAKNVFLGWERLHHIALGVAKGIEYLHQGCDQTILHFDIKPHNILLDNDFNPKIADFGLAKLCSKYKSAISMTTARGTVGYIAPEVFSRNFGNVSYKADVYSFGMLVLEMVGGRKNVDETEENGDQVYFPEWIYNLLEEGEDLRFQIEEEGDAEIAKKLAIVGLWCIQWNPVDRPSMKIVVQMLEGEGDNLTKPPNPLSSTAPKRKTASIAGRRLHQELAAISETE